MKKIINFLLIIILSLSISLNSCGFDVPRISKNFGYNFCKSFLENYSIVDSNLLYMSAAHYEVKIDDYGDSSDDLFLALIDGVDKDLFVSGTRAEYYLMGGGCASYTYIYQSQSAPNPMKYWTIKSISFLETPNYRLHYIDGEESTLKEAVSNIMNDFLETSYELKIYDSKNQEDKLFIEKMRESYLNVETTNTTGQIMFNNSDNEFHSYALLFCFEESNNIVAVSYIYFNYKAKEFYITNGRGGYAPIPSEYFDDIVEILKECGWETNPYEEIAESNSSGLYTTASPDSEVIPSDPNLPTVTTPPGR